MNNFGGICLSPLTASIKFSKYDIYRTENLNTVDSFGRFYPVCRIQMESQSQLFENTLHVVGPVRMAVFLFFKNSYVSLYSTNLPSLNFLSLSHQKTIDLLLVCVPICCRLGCWCLPCSQSLSSLTLVPILRKRKGHLSQFFAFPMKIFGQPALFHIPPNDSASDGTRALLLLTGVPNFHHQNVL